MNDEERKLIVDAKAAALNILLHNNRGNFHGLPRTAGWGYPEPYTRDLMICSLAIFLTKNKSLLDNLKRVLETLAENQSRLGSIPSLVHESDNRGASDTTPLFLMAAALYRKIMNKANFLNEPVEKAIKWMDYQSACDRIIVAQLPTSDWRDEQWVLGYGLYVNTIVYTYLRLFGLNTNANILYKEINKLPHSGLILKTKPFYAMWSYKVYKSRRFDLLGNSLAILTGIASINRTKNIINWIEKECKILKKKKLLALDLPPCLIPYIKPSNPDWIDRYKRFNQPGEYHNGGIWPFICGFYIAALVAAKEYELAEKKLIALANLVQVSRKRNIGFGFNEWYKAQNGKPSGQDWQSWSAAMYLYAANCVEKKNTPFFNEIRKK
jgi:hypothetical protein